MTKTAVTWDGLATLQQDGSCSVCGARVLLDEEVIGGRETTETDAGTGSRFIFKCMTHVPRAAVSFIERPDGRLLCVWNRRYGGWSLPGGKVEEGESNQAAQARELYEETGLRTFSSALIYTAETSMSIDADRGRIVHLFSVVPDPAGTPHEVEWLTREEFLKWSPFREFYAKAFAAIDARGGGAT